MNAIQVAMFFVIGGFLIAIWGIDQMLKRHEISSAIRNKVSWVLLILGFIIQALLAIILWKTSI
ncbi:hypothetical protein [Gottfriedia acidiceleris]|uniref:hypothetical protein n=1 Tax=Gottfriedia acidiceleris TaxID=371036 RepID=UPI003D1E3C22